MPKSSHKGILLVLLAIFLVVAVAVIPDIISEEMRAWCLSTFGEGYQGYLLGFFVVGSIILLFLTTDIGNWLRPGATPSKSDRFNIPPGAATRKQINLAKTAISQAEPEQALRHLSELKVPALDTEIATLSSRYAEYRRSSRQGINSRDEENRTYNRITKDILDLIKTLESELATGTENYQTIKDYLKKRYTNRLGQKLANRQPVNLRQLVNTEVLPEGNKPAFIEYTSEEISGALLQTFRDTRGRMLLVGVPGAGKTTLMLQLVLELLDAEPDALPVLINLATWSHEYITLEAWLKKILPAETGTGDRFAAELIHQNRLILLFDGFDEIRQEDRLSCLEAINRYGEDSQRHYVISSRKQEFKEVDKAVLVGLPIEVCPLTLEQMKAELQRLWSNPEMPEWGAKLLLDAIEKDTLLQKAVQTPFYFNILQILFNGGMTLADLQLKADTLEGRQSELGERFVEYELKAHVNEKYPAEKVSHWLSFLASRMTERNMVVFELRDLQYDWWRWGLLELIFGWVVRWGIIGFVIGIILGLIQVLILGIGGVLFLNFTNRVIIDAVVLALLQGPIFGLTLGLLFGLAGGLWRSFFPAYKTLDGLAGGLIGGLFGGLISNLAIMYFNGSFAFVILGFILGLIEGGKNKYPKIETKDIVKWSIISTVKKIMKISNLFVLLILILITGLIFKEEGDQEFALFMAVSSALIFIFIRLLAVQILEPNILFIQINTPYQRFIASVNILWFSILQHLLLRYQLYRQGLLPLHLVDFLNELTARHILETDGATWRFRHRILQEWFAEKWVEPEENKSKTK